MTDPNHPAALVEKALTHRRTGDHAAAAALLQTAAEANPNHLGIRMELARELRHLGRAAEADAVVAQVLEAEPTHLWARIESGHAARRAGDHAAAAQHFAAAMAADPAAPGIKLELARDLRALNRHDEADQLVDAVLADKPDHAGALAEKALARRRAGDHAEAVSLLQAAAAADPNHFGVRMELARDLRALTRHADADAVIDSVLALDASHPWAWVEKGHAHRRTGDHAAAAEAFARAAAREPAHIGIKLELARSHRAAHQPEAALAVLTDLVANRPGDAATILALASLLIELNQFQAAETHIKSVLLAAPTHPGALRELALLARRRGDRATSRLLFERAVRADPANLDMKLELAAELRDAGETDAARTFIDAVIRTAPAHYAAWMQLGLLERARANRPEAARAFVRAAELMPSASVPLVELAHEHWAFGDPQLARRTLDEAASRDPRNVVPLLVGAEFALSAEDPETALELTARARAIDPNSLGSYLVAARAAAALVEFPTAHAHLDAAQAALGSLPEIAATRIHLLRQTRDDDATIRGLIADVSTNVQTGFGLWIECTAFMIAQGEFDAAETALLAPPANTTRERAVVHMMRGQIAEGRRDYVAAIAAYRQAVMLWPSVGGWYAELARCHLLLAETDAARECLESSMQRDRSMRQVRGQSVNVSQHHIGQLLDEFVLDRACLEQLHAIAARPATEQIDPLCDLVATASEQTSASMLLLLAARSAGRFDRGPSEPGPVAERSIPRALVQFWDDEPPEDISELMHTWRTLNPDFEYALFDTDAAEDFIATHHALAVRQAFRRSQEPAQRADLFRLAYLSTHGGFYVDADDRCLQPLDSFVPPRTTLALYQENYGTLGNNFIGVVSGHPVIRRALEQATAAINRGDADMIWLLTGPGLLTRAFAQVAAQDADFLRSPDLLVLELWEMQRVVALHSPAHYKRTNRHWSREAFGAPGRQPSRPGTIRFVSNEQLRTVGAALSPS